MSRKNNTFFAVLGILAKGPQSGYDIRKHFNGSIRYFWSESYGQIYPTLREIVKLEYAVVQQDVKDPRKKKIYKITDAGTEAFRSWIAEPVNPITYRDELMLKLFFAKPEDRFNLLGLFENEKEELQQMRDSITAQAAGLKQFKDHESYPFWTLTIQYGLLSTEARLRWCSEVIDSLSALGKKERE
ncbi:PadR family transcriptional regulator [Marinicrinis lubricantis]|uniref:PadR family transcriptional regulator n=1 Tax=Marinicrinis lubricantis TaxID=2086470 RepID=A0ABW1IWG1_9BACL